jgi:hypothetical protein
MLTQAAIGEAGLRMVARALAEKGWQTNIDLEGAGTDRHRGGRDERRPSGSSQNRGLTE